MAARRDAQGATGSAPEQYRGAWCAQMGGDHSQARGGTPYNALHNSLCDAPYNVSCIAHAPITAYGKGHGVNIFPA